MGVRVTPESFSMVEFDPGEIAAIADGVVAEIGLTGRDVEIRVDETTPLGRVRVTSTDPVVVEAESGAFEDPKTPRHLSPAGTADVLGRLLHRVRDRSDEAFGDPPVEDELTLAQHVAWDAYSMGRMARAGHQVQRQRRLYHFRNRHGFTDAADAAFEALWDGEDLTWDDIEQRSQEALAVKPGR